MREGRIFCNRTDLILLIILGQFWCEEFKKVFFFFFFLGGGGGDLAEVCALQMLLFSLLYFVLFCEEICFTRRLVNMGPDQIIFFLLFEFS